MPTPQAGDPRWSYIDPALTLRVREVDPALQVVFDGRRQKFVVIDTEAPGGIDQRIVMIVQEPDGSFRPFDNRTVEHLRRHRMTRAPEIIAELDHAEELREREWARKNEQVGDGMAEDLKWAGMRAMGYGGNTVTWQKRTDPAARERIRAEVA